MTLAELMEQVSPGIDPADVDALAAVWRAELPDQLGVLESWAISHPTLDDAAPEHLAHAVAFAHQARYGNPRQLPASDVASWVDVGFTTEPADGDGWPDIALDRPLTTPFAAMADAYDVVVIGSGCGAIAADLATEAGARVLLVEAGTWLGSEQMVPDALRNQRVGTGLDTPAGPPNAGRPRVVGDGEVVTAADGRWGNNAFTLGGGLRVYGAQAWRFSHEDLTMASTYGVPEGSALADWPITYGDLAPHYTRAERELGCSGSREGNPFAGTSEPYPLPPVPLNRSGEIMAAAAERLGWSHNRVPLLVNSQPFGGRPACRECGACVGFPCRAEAKSGTFNTVLPRGLATGRCDLVTGTRAVRLISDKDGRISSVELADMTTGARRSVRCGRVVLAAGAVESARLLLLSAHDGEPDGLGNTTDQVGRYLQAHMYPGALGLIDDEVQDGRGPGPTVAISGFRHGNAGYVGGGMLANDFVPLPMFTLRLLQATGIVPSHGPDVHAGLVQHYRRHLMIFGPIQEVTMANSRVTLAPDVTDHLGVPVARLSGGVHPEDVRLADFMADRAVEWLEAAGCTDVRALRSRPAGPSVGQHQAGTCRMGDDPATSVVDPHCRVWGHPNLYVADTSVHVTNGAVNPVLTGLALAYRTSELMLAE